MRVPPSWLYYLPKTPPPNTNTLEVRTSIHEFCKNTNVQHITSIYTSPSSIRGFLFLHIFQHSVLSDLKHFANFVHMKWCLTVLLSILSLTSWGLISFRVFIGHMGSLFYELPIHIICPLFYLVVSLFLTNLKEIIYSAYESLVLCKYHLPVWGLS